MDAKITLWINIPEVDKNGNKMDEYSASDFINNLIKDALKSYDYQLDDQAIIDSDYDVDSISVENETDDIEDEEPSINLPEPEIIEEPLPEPEVIEEPEYYNTVEDCVKACKSIDDNVFPVGWLDPNGNWYLLTTAATGLAHIELADLIYKELKTKFSFNLIEHSAWADDVMQANGFIKVHGWDVRYFAHLNAWNKEKQQADFTPDPTKEQIEQLCKYEKILSKNYNDTYGLTINDFNHGYNSYKLRQMDELMIRTTFMI